MDASDFDSMDVEHLDRIFEEEDEEIDWDDPLAFEVFDD